jgi:hypothetical protein
MRPAIVRPFLVLAACAAAPLPAAVSWDRILVDPSPGSNRVLEKAVADISGDGRGDIIIGTGGDVRWYRFPASGNPHDPWIRTTIAQLGDAYEHMLPVDLSGDGRPDLVLSLGGALRWLQHPGGDGTGTWAVHDIAGGIAHEIRLQDLDGDGRVDVVTSRTRNVAFQGPGAASWTIMDWGGVVPGTNQDGLALLDIGSGAGQIDIVCATSSGIFWVENPREHGGAARNASAWIAHRIGSNDTGGPALATMDVDGDGRMDVLMAPNEGAQGSHGLVWWQAPADRRTGTWTMHVIDPTWQDVHWIELADIDRDGRTDLVLAEEEQSHDPAGGPYTFNNDRVAVLYATGGGGFTAQVLETTGGQNQVAADIDGDGDFDIVSANHGVYGAPNPIELFLNGLHTTGGGAGTGTGLSAQYFATPTLGGASVARIDRTVAFDWGYGSPDPAIPADRFSARWTGQVQAQRSETYTFTTTSDDGIRLWIDGRLLIDDWTDHAPRDDSATLALVAGQQYDLRLEYYENGGGAVARLAWSSPSTPRAIVPTSQLYPATAASGALGGGTAASAGGIDLTAVGSLDWAHWGRGAVLGAFDHKASGGGRISAFATVGGGSAYGGWRDPGRATSWSDGAPTMADANDTGYAWANGALGTGFAFTAPADATSRTLTVFFGASNATATVTAHLSDGSAADWSTARTGPGAWTATLTYRAASAGQSLRVQVLKTANVNGRTDGSADLVAAWLTDAADDAVPMPRATADAGAPGAPDTPGAAVFADRARAGSRRPDLDLIHRLVGGVWPL